MHDKFLRFLTFTAALGLLLILVVVQQTAYGADPMLDVVGDASGVHQPGFLFLPYVEKAPPKPTPDPNLLTISGTAVSTGAPFGEVALALQRYNPNIDGSRELIDAQFIPVSPAANSVAYTFTGVPRLESGYVYYVSYVNLDDTPGFLSSWFTQDMTNPAAGTSVVMPTFDIADVTLRAPDNGAKKSLPEDFRWNARGTATDIYILRFTEEDSQGNTLRSGVSPELSHPTSNFDVGSIEEVIGFTTEKEYFWQVLVSDGKGGFGFPQEKRTITFAELQSASMDVKQGNMLRMGEIDQLK